MNSTDDAELRFPISLRGSWFGLNRHFRDLLSPYPITPAQYTTLRNICEHEGGLLNQRMLCKLVSSNENNLAAILKKLEKLGLIQRKEVSNDRRNNSIVATSAGKELFYKAKKVAQKLEVTILAEFSDEETEQIFDSLEQCISKLDSMEENRESKV